MRFEYETFSKIIGFRMENIRFGYETSSKTIVGFTLENMRFWYETSSRTIGFSMEIMSLLWEIQQKQ